MHTVAAAGARGHHPVIRDFLSSIRRSTLSVADFALV